MRAFTRWWMVLLATGAGLSGQTSDEGGLPSTTVYADPETLVTTPEAVSRIRADELVTGQIRELRDLQSRVPNGVMRSGGSRSLNEVIGFRGVLNNPFYGEPAVGLYVDDVPFASTFTYDPVLLDVDHVDLYRGPQFTRFGRRGATGMISIYTRPPGETFRMQATSGIANHEEQFYNFTMGGPLGSQLGFTAAGQYDRRDGYLYNQTLKLRPDFRDGLAGRFALYWTPSERLEVRLSVGSQRFDDGVQRFTNTDSTPFTIDHDYFGITHQKSDVEALRVQYKGDEVTVTSITARRNFRLNPSSFDGDFSPVPALAITVFDETTQYSEELRVESAPNVFNGVKWLLGAYASWTDMDVNVRDTFPLAMAYREGKSSFTDKTAALFGELTKTFLEKLDVTLGLRAEYVAKEVRRDLRQPDTTHVETERDRPISNVSPKLQLTWHFTPDVLLYGATSVGYRGGSYSVFNFDNEVHSTDTERLWANELGAKARLFNGGLELSLAGFWYQIHDYQIERFLLTGFGDYTAEEVETRGVEFEATARPVAGLELSASVGYTDARFTEHRSATTGLDLAGKRPPYVPDVTFKAAAEYRHPCGLVGRVEYLLTGRTYFDEDNLTAEAQSAYGIMNAKLGFEQKHWGVYLFGRNLSDTEYYTLKLHGFGVGILGEPRTVGVMASLTY